jgi:hypothetical protein
MYVCSGLVQLYVHPYSVLYYSLATYDVLMYDVLTDFLV